MDLARRSMIEDGDTVAVGAPGSLSMFVDSLMAEIQHRMSALQAETGRRPLKMKAFEEAQKLMAVLNRFLKDSVFASDIIDQGKIPADDELAEAVRRLRLEKMAAVTVTDCPGEPLPKWVYDKLAQLRMEELVPTRQSVGTSMIPFVVNTQLRPGQPCPLIAPWDPTIMGLPSTRRVDSLKVQLSRTEHFYEKMSSDDVANVEMIDRMIAAVMRMEVNGDGTLAKGDMLLFSGKELKKEKCKTVLI